MAEGASARWPGFAGGRFAAENLGTDAHPDEEIGGGLDIDKLMRIVEVQKLTPEDDIPGTTRLGVWDGEGKAT